MIFNCPFATIFAVIYVQCVSQIQSQYETVWEDDLSNCNNWSTQYGTITCGYSGTGCQSGSCVQMESDKDNGYSYLVRTTDIAAYSSLRLQVSVSTYEMETDKMCAVYFEYDGDWVDDTYNKLYEWSSSDEGWHHNFNTLINLPSSSDKTTLILWLENDADTNDFCYWDNVYLLGIPEVSPTPNPTPRPTSRPTPKPTKRPTRNPTRTPTPRPTDPVGTSTCGDTVIGVYNGVPVTFMVHIPFDADIQFSAAASTFVVTDIEAFTNLNLPLGTDTDDDEQVTLIDTPAGDYKFVINGEGTASGTFEARISCVIKPTPNPTKKPTLVPTRRPTSDPVTVIPTSNPSDRPTTPSPTLPPSKNSTPKPTYAPMDHPVTVSPTKPPTKRPTRNFPQTPSKPPVELAIASAPSEPTNTDNSDSDEHTGASNEEEDLQSTVLITDLDGWRIAILCILIALCICGACGCGIFCSYKYWGDDIQKEMVDIQMKKRIAAVAVGLGESTVPQQEKDFDRDVVIQWLRYTVQLPQYAQMFFNEGYDNMRAIQAIESRDELRLLGITPAGHQALIFAEIQGLQGMDFASKSGEGGRHGVPQTVPPPPNSLSADGEGGFNVRSASNSDDVFGTGAPLDPPSNPMMEPPAAPNPMLPPPPVMPTPMGVVPVYDDDDESLDDTTADENQITEEGGIF